MWKRSCTDLMLLNMNMLVIRFCAKAWKSRLLCTLMGCHKTQYIDSASYSARMPIHSEPLGLRPTTFFFIGGQGTTWMLYSIVWFCRVKISKVTCMHGVRWHNISILGACLYAHFTFGVDLRFSNIIYQYSINLAFHSIIFFLLQAYDIIILIIYRHILTDIILINIIMIV